MVSDADRVGTGNVGFLLAKASQHWNELLAEGFAERGFAEVRPSYGSVLLPLFEDDGLRMGQIAERARLSKQTMTTMVRLCERDGLVYRERDADDARAFRIHLTERSKHFRPVVSQRRESMCLRKSRCAQAPASNWLPTSCSHRIAPDSPLKRRSGPAC